MFGTYDGVWVIRGQINGVNVLVREASETPCVNVDCHAHRLNLFLVDTAKNVSVVDYTLGLLEAINYFNRFHP